MNNAFTNSWPILLLFLLLGMMSGALLKRPAKKIINKFFKRLLLIKEYWKFVLPFFIIVVMVYALVFNYANEKYLSLYLSILGHFVTLIFAIFIGYFAFIQVAEGRLDKYKERGFNYFKQGLYNRAKIYYEKIYAIDTTDFGVLADLLELYLIQKNYSKFNEYMELLEKEVIEAREKTQVYYLKIAKDLLQGNLGSAKPLLDELVSIIIDKPESLITFYWDFTDIEKSETYKELEGECKSVFDNFKKYLAKSLSEEQKNAFEEGDYTL